MSHATQETTQKGHSTRDRPFFLSRSHIATARARQMASIIQAGRSIDWIGILSITASVAYATYIHHYVTRLERIGCDCAADFRRTYIQYFTLALIILGITNIALLLMNNRTGITLISAVLSPMMFIATIIYVVFVIQYVNRLRAEKCKCSEGMARAILYLVTIINVTLASLMALAVLYVALAGFSAVSVRPKVGK